MLRHTVACSTPKKKLEDKGKLRPDVNEVAYKVAKAATGEGPRPVRPEERTEADKSDTAKERGSKGGEKGGKARAEKLTPQEREEIACIAATARWRNGEELD